MKKNFSAADWETYLPIPVCEDVPEYGPFYRKAWALAHNHIRHIDGMPQTPYMDEAFCDTQIWIWDTCFMTLFCKYAQAVFPGIESLNNFYDVLYGEKSLPKIIPTEKEPEWTGAVPGVPSDIKIHIADNPPLFAWAEYENALVHGDIEHIKDLLYNRRVLQKHYEWVEGLKGQTLPRGVSNRTFLIHEEFGYKWEGGSSGMDNTPRGRITEKATVARPNNPDMLWVDAICQQALAAKMISRLFELAGDTESCDEWIDRYNEKKALVNQLYWDSEDQFYYDIDCKTHSFYKIMTIASYWALTAGIADTEQAAALADHIFDEKTFGGSVPLVSLSKNDADYVPHGGYWRGALWLPTAYAALKGFGEYKLYDKAHDAARRILDHMLRTYLEYEPHTIWECYSPEGYKPATEVNGRGRVRPDFCGWSALGAISVYIEYVLGFHTVNAFDNTVEWEKPSTFKKTIGIKNLRFGNVITDIMAEGNTCTVISNMPYTLRINGKAFHICSGTNSINL